MYRSGMSACEIAHAYAITRQGAESKIREGGLGGVQWCPRQTIPDSCSCPEGCECMCADCICGHQGEEYEDE
jgi:hypothetical protein